MIDLHHAQSELRTSYVHGGPGAVVSGFVWLAAAVVAGASGVATGFAVLFFGGMLIFPLGLLLARTVFRREPPTKGNPGERIVIETIPAMIGGLLAAWLLLPHAPDLVFPIAAIAVGTHYFGFRSAYGDATFWVLGAAMTLVGVAAVFTDAISAAAVPYLIAAIEIAFGLWLTWADRTRRLPAANAVRDVA